MIHLRFIFVSQVRNAIPISLPRPPPLAVQFHAGQRCYADACEPGLSTFDCSIPLAEFVLLHASYPYIRKVGHLTVMYISSKVFPVVLGYGICVISRPRTFSFRVSGVWKHLKWQWMRHKRALIISAIVGSTMSVGPDSCFGRARVAALPNTRNQASSVVQLKTAINNDRQDATILWAITSVTS